MSLLVLGFCCCCFFHFELSNFFFLSGAYKLLIPQDGEMSAEQLLEADGAGINNLAGNPLW
jgi:hypothetical protein